MTSVSLKSLQEERSTLYLLDNDFNIRWLNSGWFEFARNNGGEAVLEHDYIGDNVLEVISVPLRDFFTHFFKTIQKTREPDKHFYECGSSTIFRLYHMMVFPLSAGGLLTVHSPVVEKPYDDRVPVPANQELYVGKNGLIQQCSHCRRVKRTGRDGSWDWVPDYIDRPPPNISHGLCIVCYQYYYPATSSS